MTVNATRRKKKQLYDQLYKARKVEVNVGTFRHYSVQEPKTRSSVYHQPPSYSENLYKEDILPEGLFDLIVFSSTSLLVAIFSNLNSPVHRSFMVLSVCVCVCQLRHGLPAHTAEGTD